MSKPITGKHVLFGLIGFFAVVFTVNGIFLSSAIRSFPGEAVEKSYLQGVAYNDTLEQRQEQAALGWQAQIGLIESADQQVLLARLTDRQGAALGGLTVNAQIVRHDGDHAIHNLSLTSRGSGEFVAPFPADSAGRWSIELKATGDAQQTFIATKDIYSR